MISLTKEHGEKTFYETTLSDKKNKLAEANNSVIVKSVLSAFPDARLIDVTENSDE